MRRTAWSITLLLALATTLVAVFSTSFSTEPPQTASVPLPAQIGALRALPNIPAEPATTAPPIVTNTPPPSAPTEPVLPDEVVLAVPFTSQAPHANWALPYQEACEEAAGVMVHWYWEEKAKSQKEKGRSKEAADAAILDLVQFQQERYGFYKDTTVEETARFLRDRWGYTVEVVTNPTVQQMKQELAAGYPIIMPAAGRQLGNPNFRQPGPLYHMLVLIGYAKNNVIITNDPGTRKGAGYRYAAATLLHAMHDWNGGNVEEGKKVIIVVRGQ